MLNLSKEDIICVLVELSNYCEGAIMASDDNQNLHSFAFSMQNKIIALKVELRSSEVK